MYLAELNISNWKVSPEAEIARGFVDNLDRINAMADRSEGFVWRLITDGTDDQTETPLGGPEMIVNMSVWEKPENLEHFVWNTVHKQIYNKRAEWFSHIESHRFVMWWVEEGHVPDLHEAKERLDFLNEHGDSDQAFGWSHLPHIKLWQQQSCA